MPRVVPAVLTGSLNPVAVIWPLCAISPVFKTACCIGLEPLIVQLISTGNGGTIGSKITKSSAIAVSVQPEP